MFARALSSSASNVRKPAPLKHAKKERPKSDTANASTWINQSKNQGKPAKTDESKTREDGCSVSATQILERAQERDSKRVFEVNLHAQKLKKIPDLQQFPKVRIVDLSCNEILSISGLENLNEVKELKLYSNKIEEIKGMEKLKELQNLLLQHNRIKTIGKGLQSVRKLKVLRLDSNLLSSIDHREIATCGDLTVLDISNNQISDLSAINSLSALEELDAAANRLTKIPVINRCRHLQEIDFSRNQIHDLSGLKGLINLNILHVESNQLTSLSSVGKLRNLQELYVSHNKISSLKDFTQQFPSLEVLIISHNAVISLEEFLHLSKSSIVELYTTGNPCIDVEDPGYHQQVHKMIPSLEMIDGVSLKRPTSSCGRPKPLMRPMTASQVLSSRHVEEQIKAALFQQTSFEESIAKRFNSMKDLFDTLPTELPKSSTYLYQEETASNASSPEEIPNSSGSPRPTSRCSTRSRITDARLFASEHFHRDEG